MAPIRAVVVAFLRRRRVQVYPYLDNLVKGCTRLQVEADVSLIRSTFNKLGLMANEQKSILMPAQRTEFIGAVLDLGQAKSIPPGSSLFGPQHQRT